jgi:hypothetical protein
MPLLTTAVVAAAVAFERTTKTAVVIHRQKSTKRDGKSTKRNTSINYKLQQKKHWWQWQWQ